MGKGRSYWGCEMESPLYWEVHNELKSKSNGSQGSNQGTKRGKRRQNTKTRTME